MSYRIEPTHEGSDLIIDGFEKGIAPSPYNGIANMRNVGISYMPGVAYVNYKRQAATLVAGEWYAGTHSTDAGNNVGWIFTAAGTVVMGNPVAKAQSPAGLNYILDSLGQVFKQTAVNSSSFTKIEDGLGRLTNGSGGLAYWNNYIVVFGNGMIEFCGNGTNDAGIISTNWNINNTNYYSNLIPCQPEQFQATGGINLGATSATLNANWPYPTQSGTATIIFSTGETRTGTVTNGSPSLTWTGATTLNATTLVFISSPSIYTSTSQGIVAGNQIVFSTTGTMPSPLVAGQIYYAATSQTSEAGGYSFQVASTPGGTAITITSLGSNLSYSIDNVISLPIGNVSTMTFTNPILNGTTSATISSYVLPNGTTVSTYWLLPTGTYNVVDSNGNNMLAGFTFSSSAVNFIAPVQQYSSGNYSVQILNPNYQNKAFNGIDGFLYFTNGSAMGVLSKFQSNTVINFNPSNALVFNVSYNAFSLATSENAGSDYIVDATNLQDSMVVAGTRSVFAWNYTGAFTEAPVPIGHQISKLINILNIIFVVGGQKGNIYTSNGAYAQLLAKIPDYITGVIDPVWSFGDVMKHRSRLYFQASAQDTSGNNLLSGVFSVGVSPTVIGDTEQSITMEAQNSYGLVQASGATSAGLLIDNEPSSSGQDSYYSAYSTGASTGGIDYNSTLLWGNNEPVIETDIIPIGNYLIKKTLGAIEFKLDRPLATGDSLALYWRPSLSDAWVSIPLIDSSSSLISNYGISAINQSQWAQFKMTYSAASSSSSFIPVRELRLHINGQ